MRVSTKTSGPAAPSKVGTPAPAATSGPVGSVLPSDALTVSSGAHLIAEVQARIATIPDVRTDKVEAIRAQMDAENYYPDSGAVADGIVKEYTPPGTER